MSRAIRAVSRRRRAYLGAALAAFLTAYGAPARADADAADLSELSLEDLMDIEVTSVSKRPQKLSQAPAAITVLTAEDIHRAGHTSIAEALRMVPGLHVAHINSNQWAITSRGLNFRFANKLLVLIDGRSVYTPLFSGVYWGLQDVPLEDVDRIEVIRGPGGTLWGANAVNGVINVITKRADETQGVLLSGAAGDPLTASGTARWGGAVGDDLHYRVWAKAFDHGEFDTPQNHGAGDDWHQARGGFRADWEPSSRDLLTFQGDYFDGEADMNSVFVTGTDTADFSGGYLLGRWSRSLSDGSRISLQGYWDHFEREEGLAGETRDTFDLEFQHDLTLFARNDVTWGLNYRATSDRLQDTPFTTFDPDDDTVHLVSGFVQNEFAIVPERLSLTLGSKFEHNDYTGFEYQPSARFGWTPSDRHTLWGAVSRAVRTPSRVENDIDLILPFQSLGILADLDGNTDFDSEELLAYELGYRGLLTDSLSLDVAGFYFDYDDLRTVDIVGPGTPPAAVATLFGNRMRGESHGVEVEATWRALDNWKLTASYTLLDVDLELKGSSTDPVSELTEGDAPEHQFQVRSLLDLPWNLQLDAAVYWVDTVPNQEDADGRTIGSYWRGDLRVGWTPRHDLELELVGQNLFERSHPEYGGLFTVPTYVPRGYFARITWRR